MSDVCFDELGTIYGFADHQSAANFLLEDEYRRLDGMDSADEEEFEINLAEIYPPSWEDHDEQPFKYLGKY